MKYSRDLSRPLAPTFGPGGRGKKQKRQNSDNTNMSKSDYGIKVAQANKQKTDSILADYKIKSDAQKAYGIKVAQANKQKTVRQLNILRRK